MNETVGNLQEQLHQKAVTKYNDQLFEIAKKLVEMGFGELTTPAGWILRDLVKDANHMVNEKPDIFAWEDGDVNPEEFVIMLKQIAPNFDEVQQKVIDDIESELTSDLLRQVELSKTLESSEN